VSGRVTFDRIEFKTTVGTGLNPDAPVASPARQVVVEAIAANDNAVLASTTTDAAGDYSLSVPANRNLFIRAKAQMLKTDAAPTWDFRVRNNNNAGALYVLDGASFDSGATDSTRNLHAPAGWGGSAYTAARAAAPFAILDAVHEAKELVLSAASSAEFPALSLFWSVNNRPTVGLFCPEDGDIGTTSYIVFPPAPNNLDECNRPVPEGIYILGDFTQGDTDEFDAHVIAHEFGHYFEDRLSRSDSIGGQHSGGQRLDLRLAFGEGWGNAFAAMSLNDPVYRDSQNRMAADVGFDLEADDTTAEGWFSESSIGEILWDLYDSSADGADMIALGFAPIYAVMTGPQTTTEAFTSIFSFASALKAAASGSSAAVNALLNAESIFGADAFGAGESNDGAVPGVLPIYQLVALPSQTTFCTSAAAGATDLNRLGNRKFLRLEVPASGATVTIQVTGVAAAGAIAAVDPDIFVFRRGAVVGFSEDPPTPGQNPAQETLAQLALSAGTHIIEIYDFDLLNGSSSRCMSAAITGQ
jgi:hypothetical protein